MIGMRSKSHLILDPPSSGQHFLGPRFQVFWKRKSTSLNFLQPQQNSPLPKTRNKYFMKPIKKFFLLFFFLFAAFFSFFFFFLINKPSTVRTSVSRTYVYEVFLHKRLTKQYLFFCSRRIFFYSVYYLYNTFLFHPSRTNSWLLFFYLIGLGQCFSS